MHAILRCYDPVKEWEQRLNKFKGKALFDIMKDERDAFGLFQREETPLEIIDTIIGKHGSYLFVLYTDVINSGEPAPFPWPWQYV
jgi:hypothetical protein